MPDTPRPITQHHRAAVALLIMFDLLQEVADEARTGSVAPATAAQAITELGFAAWMDAIGAPPSDFHLHAHRLANEAVEVMPGQRVDDDIVRLALEDPAAFLDAIRELREAR